MKHTVNICFDGDNEQLRAGAAYLLPDLGFDEGEGGLCITPEKWEKAQLAVTRRGRDVTVRYRDRVHFFRALGLVAEHFDETEYKIVEPVVFDTNGVMFDVSQSNTMMTKEHAERLMRRMALMGLNMFMFYSEDGFDIPEWPYFGHMRARFSREEMRAMDDYADALGIEMIPCIQTLAHLTDPLRWPCFAGMRESHHCLLPGEEKVYQFIEDLIVAASSMVRSRRIHIGMDEAMNLGRGKYMLKHGLVDAGEIMMAHLQRVMSIVRKHGLRPMLWGDMFYKKAYAGHCIYQQNYGHMEQNLRPCVLPNGVTQPADVDFLESFPKDAQIISYDYSPHEPEAWDLLLNQGKMFGLPPVFAGGIWGWTSFCPNWRLTFNASVEALAACRRNGVREVFATTWGDEETECPVDALLLGMQLYAEMGYSETYDEEKLKKRYTFLTGADYDATVLLQEMDNIPGCAEGNADNFNATKCLLWQDPMCGMFDKDLEGNEAAIEQHYRDLAARFEAQSRKPSELSDVFGLIARLSQVLADKATLGNRLKALYDGDRAGLTAFTETVLPRLIAAEKELYAYHRDLFFKSNKAFGWETFELRYGTVIGRTETALWRLRQYLAGEVRELDELKEERLYMHGHPALKTHLCYATIVAANRFTSDCGYPIAP